MPYTILPLHPAQLDVFTDQLINSESPKYNIGGYIKLKGLLDKKKFNETINSAPQVFDAFKMRFDLNEEDPCCYYDEGYKKTDLTEVDFRNAGNPAEDAIDWMKKELNTPFLIRKNNCLFENSLLTIADDEHWYFMKFHHLITDGYGFIVWIKYVSRKYTSLIAGSNIEFNYPQYREEAVKAFNYNNSSNYESDSKYWKDKINTKPDKLLQRKYSLADSAGTKSDTYVLSLNKNQQKLLEEIQILTKTGLQQLTIAALLIYFGKTSDQSEFVFGIPIHKRGSKQLRNIIGMFSGILPYKGTFHNDIILEDLLKDISSSQKKDYRHHHYLIGDLSRHLKINSNEGYLSEVSIDYEPFQFELIFGKEIEATIFRLINEYDRNALQLCWQDYGNQQPLQLHIYYANEYFNNEEIELFAERVLFILEQFPIGLNKRVGSIDFLPVQEREILCTFGSSVVEYERGRTITEIFEDRVAGVPEGVAVVFGEEELTYRELNERSNQLGHYLRKRGVMEDMLVPVCIGRSIEMVVGILGILKAGGVYVPVDPGYPGERIGYMLEDTGAVVVVSSREGRVNIGVREGLEIIEIDTEWSAISCEVSGNMERVVGVDNLAYVIYTSGSTGRPKGVMIEHGALLDHCYGVIGSAGLGQCSSFALFSPLVFDAGHSILHSCFIVGGSLHVLPDRLIMDGEALREYLDRAAIECIKIVPSLWLSYAESGHIALSKKVMIFGGEAFLGVISDYLVRSGYGGEVYNHYGPTEATIGKCIYKVDINRRLGSSVPIGKPFSNTKIYIVNSYDELVPVGVLGEICIGGEGLARGYLHHDKLTHQKFVRDVFSKDVGARMYKTGDLGYWLLDGNIEYAGRADEQVKIRGYRIELGEIEYELQQSGLVTQAVVVAREDREGNRRLVGYVVVGKGFSAEAATGYLRKKLPEYMIPVLWKEIESVPLTSNGKVDKKALPEGDVSVMSDKEYAAPRTEMEEKLTVIWQELLGIQRIGVHDNFFDLGGHSLLALRIVSAVRKVLEVEIVIKDLFDYSTIAKLAAYIQVQHKGLSVPSVAIQVRPEHIPLSFGQERLWFIDQLEGSVQYHIPAVLRLEGHLNKEALGDALQEIINRHEVLRTVIREKDGLGYQYIKEMDGWKLSVVDGEVYKEDADGLQAYIEGVINKPFDLSKDYMLRAELIKIEEQEHILAVTMHHIASDAWSKSILVGELGELYKAYEEGRSAELAALGIQYGDYAIWQRRHLSAEVFERKAGYWKDKLEGLSVLQLPVDYVRSSVQGTRGGVAVFGIDRELSEGIVGLSRQRGATIFMTLLSVFKVLLYRYSGQQDICVGTSIATRQHEVEGLIGFFVNTLALRDEVNGEVPFTELLDQVKKTTLEAYEHQEVPFEKVVEVAVKEREPGRSPLFQVMLVLQNTPIPFEFNISDLRVLRKELEYNTSKFDLTFFVAETDDGIQGGVQYRRDLFKGETIGRMVCHFKELLRSAVMRPWERVGKLGMLSEEEEVELRGFGESGVEYLKGRTVIGLFEEQAERVPGAMAVLYEGEGMTYRDLNERSNQLGHYLRSRGVSGGMLVPLYMERSLGMVVGMVGILKSGGAYVPIDTEFPLERVRYMVKDTGAVVVVSSRQSGGRLPELEGVEVIETDGEWSMVKFQSALNVDAAVKTGDLAYVIYTSGSTGRPKGVMIEHGSLVDYVYGLKERIGIGESKTFGLVSTIAADLGNTVIYSSLLTGGLLHVFSKEAVNDVSVLHGYFKEYGIDCLKIVPSHWKALSMDNELLLPARLLIFGGEALQTELVERIKIRGSGCRIVNHYGPTETTIGKLVHEIREGISYGVTIPVGKPFSNTSVYVLTKELSLCPVGVWGQLYIGGEGVGRGYLNNEELTGEKFIKDPFKKAGGTLMYGTGDMVRYREDGEIEFMGRADEQVKIRGYRIELGEIESVLLGSDLVREAAVVAGEDRSGGRRLVGYIAGEGVFDLEGIIRYARERLPDYMVPGLWVEVDRLPLTANGKIDRKSLPAAEVGEGLSKGYAGGRDEAERKLVGIWEELLEVERVGIYDDFFEMGGHSLLAIRLISQIRKAFGAEVKISDVFDYPTICLLAEHMRGGVNEDILPSIGVQERPELIPLSFSQERLWFIDQLEGSVQYHLPAVLRIRGNLNRDALSSSFKEIVNRHEVLRTVIGEQEGHPYQYIKERGGWELSVVDGEVYKEDADGLQAYIEELNNKPFDLSKDYMLRAELIKIEEQEHILAVTMHHIASDAWSTHVLVTELVKLYSFYDEGCGSELAALGIQYGDYAIWQRRYLSAEVFERKAGYWKDKLEGLSVLQLPVDYVRSSVQGTRGGVAVFGIDGELSEGIVGLSRQRGATIFMTLLSVFKVLLYRYSGQQDICVGTSVANRTQHEVEGLIGFFVNTLALRDEVNGEVPFTELLDQVKKTTLEAYEHQEVPFEKVVEVAVKEREPGRSPLFQVMFVLRNAPEIPDLQLGELRLINEGYVHNTSKFDLTFFVAETDDGMRGSVQYRRDLFKGETIGRMVCHFKELLRSAVMRPWERVGKLGMLSEEEEVELRGFGESGVEYLKGRTVIGLFEEQAERVPGAMAVLYEGEGMTYRDLNERSNQLGHYLRSRGVSGGMLVPLYMERSLGMVVGMVGILKSGGAYVPIDTEFPLERVRYMVKDTGAVVVVSSRQSGGRLPELEGVEVIETDGEWSMVKFQSALNVDAAVKTGDLAYVIYTSGSTGRPKGVMIEHGSLVDYVYGLKERIGIGESKTFGLVSTIAADLGNTVIYSSLLTGGLLHVFSKEAVNDVSVLHGYFKEYGIDCLKIVPSHWKALSMDNELLLPARLLIFGGEALQTELVERIKIRGSGCRIVNHYGPTETTIGKLVHEIREGISYGVTIPVGKPFSNTSVYVLTKELSLCPVGVWGQLYIGGEGVGRGYLNNEELTGEKFIKDPFKKAGGTLMYGTGDMVRYREDGEIEFMGRADEQVKIRGYRIELGEIESVLLGSDLVREAAVVAGEDRSGGRRLVGYIAGEGVFDLEGIIRYARERLPDYMVPGLWVEVDRLPLTANGKIDRKSLPAAEVGEGLSKGYAGGRDEAERKLVGIWEELLEVERVGIYDDFFEMGGHSLLAIRLISQIRKAFGAEVKISDVFDYPTICLLAEHMRGGVNEDILPSIGVQERPELIPLSFSQERLWFIDQLEGSVQYHISHVLRIRGNLNRDALSSSFKEIVNRHEVLRTVIGEQEGHPYQYIKERGGWELSVVDGEVYKEDADGLQAYIEELNNKPFDLSKDYMLRADLIKIEEQEQVLVLTLHHIASDGWSRSVLVTELVKLYSLYAEGNAAQLQPLAIQYADYAIWQRRYLLGELWERKIGYWKEKLGGTVALQLWTDYVRPAVQSTRGSRESFSIDKEISEGLQVLSRKEGVTLFMTLLSVVKVLLYRYSGQQDICVGSAIAGRQQQELEGLIGFFVNTLALRDKVNGEGSFSELLAQVKVTTLQAYEHQEVPFEKVVDAVVKERDLSRNPLFQVMFVLQNTPEVPRVELGEVTLSRDLFAHNTSRFDLTFTITEDIDILRGSVEYCTDLYKRETIERMMVHFKELVRCVVREPDERIGMLGMLSESEKDQLLVDFNNTASFYPKDKTIIDLFEDQVIKTPDALAAVFEQDEITYKQLNERSNRLGHYLREKGVREETLVPVCIERSIEMVVGILGILKSGGAYVPIDVEYPAERIGYMLEDTGAVVVVSSRESRVKVGVRAGIEIIETTDGGTESSHREENLKTSVSPCQLAYVIYTSGSTGKPKGVMIEHRSLVNYLLNSKARYVSEGGGNSGSFIHLSCTFDASLTGMFMPLLSGKSIIVGSRHGVEVFEDSNLRRYAPYDFIKITPSHLELLQGLMRDGSGELLTDRLVIGGEALRGGHFSYFADKGIDVEVINEYGPTEATVGCSTYCFRTIGDQEKIKKGVSVGKPIDNALIYILGESNEMVPVGVVGEICVGGAGVARGYLNLEGLTAEKFIADPFSKEEGARLYKTGDIGRWLSDGNIEYAGRKDEQVKIRGYRIEPGEIESVVMQSGLVSQAVVVVREDKEGNKRLAGYVVPEEEFDTEVLIMYLRGKLPEYMVPVLWVKLEELPLTVNGKIDRKSLPEADGVELLSKEYEAPNNEMEEKLAAIWQELLHVDRVGVHDNFFKAGGHSLLAMRLISAIRNAMEVEVVIKNLFIFPTIRELGLYLKGQGKGLVLPSIGVQERPELVPLSFSQERLWFIDQLEGSVQYHIAQVLRLKGRLKPEALSGALQRIVNRHEVLRTVILDQEGHPYQYVKEKGVWGLGIVDGRGYKEDALGFEDLIYGLINHPFDLSKDDMLRADLIEVEDQEHVLVVTFHHIASDGWSTSVFVRELVEIYRSYEEGREAQLAVLPVQYADYAIWQRRYLLGELWERKIGYWKEKLGGSVALQLWTDYVRPAIQSTRGSRESFSIDKEISEGLQVLSRKEGVTLFMTLLSVVKVLLYRYSGQQDICVGSAIAGRQQQELEGLIGFFVNTLALRDKVNGEGSFSELLAQVKVTTLQAYEHQEVPFERVVEAVVKERDLSRSPLFQVMFVLQNTPEVPRVELGEVTLSRETFIQSTAKFDLSFSITETGGGLRGSVQYCTDLYKRETIERMMVHFKELVRCVVREPDERIGMLGMLSESEKDQLLVDFNNTASFYPKDKTIIDLFEDQVIKTPDALAAVFEQDEITYKQLNERSNRLGHYLREKGVREETLVPVCIERSIEMVVGILGILKSGGAYVPIDVEYPAERIGYMLEDTGAVVVVSSRESRVKVGVRAGIEIIETTDGGTESSHREENLKTSVSPCQLAYVIYTSGSTGKPKGVMIEHRSLVNYLLNSKARYVSEGGGNSGSFIHLSCTFDASLTGMFMPLLSGKSIIVGSRHGVEVFEDSNLRRYAPYDFIKITPSHLELLQGVMRDGSGELLTDRLVIGGEALRGGHFSYFADKGIDVEVINEYGPTEATVGCSTYCFRTIGDQEKIKKGVSVGKPIDNASIYILGESNEMVPVGVVGEICVGGAGVARGYLNLEGLTAEKFIADPFSKEEGARLYRTGDIGRWLSDGNIEYAGRKDEQVKIRGYRIEPGEIESVVMQSGLVSQAVVVVREDKEGNKRLAGYVVPEEGFDTEVLIMYLRGKLPEYMVPVLWVKLEELPLTVNGKIDRKSLPEAGGVELSKEYEAPRNEIEEKLAAIWQELLHVDRVGIRDNFFELGGDSIITIQVTSRAKRLGYSIQPKDLFVQQTISNLSRAVSERSEAGVFGEQGHLKGFSGLLPIQQWYLEKERAEISHFNQSVLLKIDKSITEPVLQSAVRQLILHHDALRFQYYQRDGKWQQLYGGYEGEVITEDLQSEPDTLPGVLISKYADSHQGKLDITKGKLIRVIWMRTPEKETKNRLLIIIHHLAIDGVSWRILLEDMEALISGLKNGQVIDLGKKSSSYRQWYEGLAKYGQSQTLLSQRGYWQKAVKSYEPLRVDMDCDENVTVKDTGSFSIRLSAEQTRQLLQEVPKVYHTEINDMLLAALAKTLCKWSGTDKVTIGLEGHGREEIAEWIDTSRTVGWFTNLFPIVLEIGRGKREDDLIKGVKEQLRGVPSKGLGYGVLKYINKDEILQGKESWDVIFNYLGQLDNVVSENKWITRAGESSGSGTSEEYVVREKLSINSLVKEGSLLLTWRYSTKHFYQNTVRKIAEDYLSNLEFLIAHCLKRQVFGEREYTPSDYGIGSEVSYQELDRFLELEEDNIDNIMSF